MSRRERTGFCVWTAAKRTDRNGADMQKNKMWIYGGVLFICCLLTGIFYQVNSPRRFVAAEAVLLVVVCLLAWMMHRRGMEEAGVVLIVGAAFLLRAGYIIYTPTWVRQHDVIGFGTGFGQAGLIEYYYENRKLIDFDPRTLWGFFQPPLHHMLAAVWLRLNVAAGVAYNHACENVQVLTLLYGMAVTVYSYLIMKEFRLTGKALLSGLCLVVLHPCFILMSGSINNDMLCILLQVMAVYYLLRWYQRPRWGTVAVLALCVGGSMMAKQSGILIAPAMAAVFLYRFGKEKEKRRLLFCQYLLFGVLSIPLGIWSPVRNLVLFGVPLNYTPGVGEPVGDYPLLRRIFDLRTDIPYTHLTASGHSYDEFNVPLSMLKTSLLGEYDFGQAVASVTPFAWILLISGGLLAVAAFFCTVAVLRRKDCGMDFPGKIFFGLYYGVSLLFYINLCFSIPNFSSQDFRYIAHLLVIEGLFLGLYRQYGEGQQKKRWIGPAFNVLLLAFSISSAAVYLLTGLYQWK